MTEPRWKDSTKSFGSDHIDPEREEKLKWIQIETENKIRRSLKLIKSINQKGNLKKKTELIQLIADIEKEYQSICALYDDLRGEVRKTVRGKDEAGSSSSSSSLNSDTEYYTPKALNGRHSVPNSEYQNVKDSDNQKSETSDLEDAILKDKLTSTTEIKKNPSVESLVSLNDVSGSILIFKDLKIQEEQSQSMSQMLLEECAQLKERLNEKEEEILSITKSHQAFRDLKLSEIQKLEAQMTGLKIELETVSMQNKAFEEKVECKSKEAKQMMEENSGLQVQIAELESILKEKENQCCSLLEKFKECENQSLSKFEGLISQVNNLQLEVNTLRSQKCISEEQLQHESKERYVDDSGLIEQVNSLQQQLEFVSSQKSELGSQPKGKSQEVTECLVQLEKLKDKLTNKALHEDETTEDNVGLKAKVNDLELEISSLSSQKNELENQIISTKSEAYHLKIENEKLYARTFVLETATKEKENELCTLQKKFEAQENEMSTQVRSLTAQISNFKQNLETLRDEKSGLQLQLEQEKQVYSKSLSHMETKNIELTNKIADQQKIVRGLEDVVNKLKEELKQVHSMLDDSKSNFKIAERKIEEMAEEFFKKCEDNLRILSRRIRVAEQLHVENKEWYQNTKDRYLDLKERVEKKEVWLSNVKDMTLTADDTLSDLDVVALKFEGCTANFLNRISKASCELKFAKDWMKRKNKTMLHIKDDQDCLLAQLDDKEAEILAYREKVWKSENKVRELEKLIKENEEAMLGLKEEKREAIRQLCIWIDDHRNHSDYYKKMISDMTSASRKTT
ncbi:hypothetical protein ACH5RR_041698 [Cinchona calisaya]|uniref:NAB domain-containing protein n=1 Tax=Cinchona calisaya TaxID=153742 RepID=A0ABD2XUA9_9GENT